MPGNSLKTKGPEAKSFWPELFWIFLKIGALTLGGGYAIVPLIYEEVVQRRKWLDEDTFFSGMVITQAIPGANAVNMAAFAGYRLGGFLGAFLAITASVIPAFLIIAFLGATFFHYAELPGMSAAFEGLRAGMIGFLLYVLGDWAKRLLGSWLGFLIFILATFCLIYWQLHPALIIALGGIIGFLLTPQKEEKKSGEEPQ